MSLFSILRGAFYVSLINGMRSNSRNPHQRCIQSGMSTIAVQRLIRHSSIAVTERYAAMWGEGLTFITIEAAEDAETKK